MTRSPKLSPSKRELRAKQQARADRAHERYVQRTYGLEAGEYERRLEDQDTRCALCMRRPRQRRLAVDHDHNTGTVRALLCYLCNKYLGQWEGDPIAAHNASLYLAEIAAAYGDAFRPAVSERSMEPRPAPAPRQVLLRPIRITRATS